MEYGLTGKRVRIIGKQKWTMEKGGREEGRKEGMKEVNGQAAAPKGSPSLTSQPASRLVGSSFVVQSASSFISSSLFPSSSLRLSHPLLFSLRLSIASEEEGRRREEDEPMDMEYGYGTKQTMELILCLIPQPQIRTINHFTYVIHRHLILM
jgi:hypothetical protein